MRESSAAWSQAAAAAFGLDRRLRVVVVESATRVEAVAPLVSGGSLPGPWRLIGMRQLAEPAEFISRNAPALERLTRALAERRVPLHLARVPVDSATLPALRDSHRGLGLFLERRAVSCPRILLDSGWEEPEGRLDGTRRQDLRRARRRAESHGPVRCEILAPRPAEVPALLDEAYRVEATGWKGRQRTALAYDAPRGVFFRHLAIATARRGWLRLLVHPPSLSALVALGFEGARSTWHKAWTAVHPH